jgi:hypothetical protein
MGLPEVVGIRTSAVLPVVLGVLDRLLPATGLLVSVENRKFQQVVTTNIRKINC